MHRYSRWLGAAAVAHTVSMSACGARVPTDGSSGGEQTVEAACSEFADAAGWHPGEAVAATAEASSERIAAVGQATWPLALELLQSVPTSELGNIAQSPTSLYAALGMAYARWPSGQCGASVASVLQFPETGEGIHQAIGAGLRTLGQRALPAEEEQPAVVLKLAPSRWVFGADQAPIGDIERIYGATPHAVWDQGEASRSLINCVIEEQSAGLLKDFIPEGVIDGETLALDINVTYLKAPWPRAFSKAQVDFQPEEGETRSVDGLHSDSLFAAYYEASTFDSIQLPLRGDQLRVLLVVPNDTVTESLSSFAESLTEEELSKARDTASSDLFEFSMPQIDIPSVSLNYSERLGFECEPFALGDLIHGAAVVMDEGGIEAVAATVAETKGDGAIEPSGRPFKVERPFLFFVYDTETKFVLFNGRVLDPK